MRKLLKKRDENSHKGDYGKVAIIGGSVELTGAAYLAAMASLRTGSGYVYSLIPASLQTIMSIKLTEAIIKPVQDGGTGHFIMDSLQDILKDIKGMDAIALGPGMGVDANRTFLVKEIVKNARVPIVLDADAINCISDDTDALKDHKTSIVITPHPGELARFLDISIEKLEEKRVYYSELVAKKHNIIVVLKGHRTVVASPRQGIYINETGNPGMASAGSGDVLTGMIASLMGQGIRAFDAAKLGVHLHGIAGDLAKEEMGEYGMIARDIIRNLPLAIKTYNL